MKILSRVTGLYRSKERDVEIEASVCLQRRQQMNQHNRANGQYAGLENIQSAHFEGLFKE